MIIFFIYFETLPEIISINLVVLIGRRLVTRCAVCQCWRFNWQRGRGEFTLLGFVCTVSCHSLRWTLYFFMSGQIQWETSTCPTAFTGDTLRSSSACAEKSPVKYIRLLYRVFQELSASEDPPPENTDAKVSVISQSIFKIKQLESEGSWSVATLSFITQVGFSSLTWLQ